MAWLLSPKSWFKFLEMKIVKGDKILVIRGKYRGKSGTVLKSMPGEERVVVEGINLAKKHTKPKQSGEKGKILEIPMPIVVSALKLICGKCKKATRIGYRYIVEKDEKKKVRICKKCGKEL